jgi:hypothetical protein
MVLLLIKEEPMKLAMAEADELQPALEVLNAGQGSREELDTKCNKPRFQIKSYQISEPPALPR